MNCTLKTRKWWLSCKAFTVYVESDQNNRVIAAQSAPLVRTFDNQYISHLVSWMRKIGGFKYYEYTKI